MRPNNETDLAYDGEEPPDAHLAGVSKQCLNAVSHEPLHKGGSSYRSHNLVVSRNCAIFVVSHAAHIWQSIMVTMTLMNIGAGIFLITFGPAIVTRIGGVIWSLAGIGFMTLFLCLIQEKPVCFDRRLGRAWKSGRWGFEKQLDQIKGLQVLYKQLTVLDSGVLRCWELNLILSDNSRVHVLSHGKRHALMDDARTLAEFLNVPLLDHTTDKPRKSFWCPWR